VTGEFGRLLGHQSSITRLTEEHAEARITPGEIFTVGQRVRILPNHACTVVNLHDRLLGVRGETIATEFVVSARGCVQ
jgi:D-serine deaminase-like pyridoxal phosphate-dependent protein